jgi:nitrous oxidase accessory protein
MGNEYKVFVLMLVILLTVLFVSSKITSGTPSKIIVVPDNYSTVAAAVGNASSGDTILIRSGIYLESSLTINKTLSLIGENAQNTIIKDNDQPTMFMGSPLFAGPNTITIKADNVVIQSLTIITTRGDIPGYDIVGGGKGTQILNCILPEGINLSTGSYQLINHNNIGKIVTNDAALTTKTHYTYITNNTVIGTVQISLSNNIVYQNTVTATNDNLTWHAWGIDVCGTQNLIAKNTIGNSRAGIVNDQSDHNTIVGNKISNGYIGLASVKGDGSNQFYANNITGNSYAVVASGYKDTYYDNNFVNNEHQIGSPDYLIGPNPNPLTYWNKGTQGNYWSTYIGSDNDGDGIGDTLCYRRQQFRFLSTHETFQFDNLHSA